MSEEKTRFEALFLDTRGPLLAYLIRRAPAEEAADLLAEVYLVAWRRRADLPAGNETRLWLFGVARRLVAEHHRLAGRRHDAEGELRGLPDGHAPADDERIEEVRRALDGLGDVDRELVTLTTWDGLSPAEASRVLGITAGTARVRLHRARARLMRNPRLRALVPAGDDPPRARLALEVLSS